MEEVSRDVINLTADILIAKDKSEWQMAIDSYVKAGKTEGEAFGLALADQAAAMGLDFLGGAISGGVMSSGGVAINRISNQVQYSGLVNKIKGFVDKLARKIRWYYGSLNPDSFEGRMVGQMTDAIGEIQDKFAEDLVEASENYQSSLTPGEEGVVVNEGGDPEIAAEHVEQANRDLEAVQLSDRDYGFKDYDVVSAVYTIRNEKAERGHDLVKIGSMPELYRDLFGLSGDVYVSNEHLYQNMVSRKVAESEGRFKVDAEADYHDLGEEKIINAIEQFQDPLVIMESLKDFDEPRLVAILDETGKDGQNLLAVMELYAPRTYPGSNQRRNHVLITIYEKDSLPDYIEKTVNKDRILHKKEGLHQKRQAGLQLAGAVTEETLKKNIARFNKKVNAFKLQNKIDYSDRADESVSNRSLLANAFEGLVQNDIERNKLQEYKDKIGLINAEEQKLRKLNEQIKELSFAKGPRDTKAIRDLQDEAKKTANRINIYDTQLLRLEASKPLQNVLERETKKAYQRAVQKGEEARKKGVEGRHKTAMRHKIQNVVKELNDLLLNESKKRHVPDSLKKAVAAALDLVNMDTVGAEQRAAKYAELIAKETDQDKIYAYTVTMENILRKGEKMGQRLKELHDAYTGDGAGHRAGCLDELGQCHG